MKRNKFNPDALISLRTAAGLTLREVAAAVMVDHVTVHKWESGKTKHPDAQSIQRLADFFHTTPGYFYYGFDSSKKEGLADSDFRKRCARSFGAAIDYLIHDSGLNHRKRIANKDFKSFKITTPDEAVIIHSDSPLPDDREKYEIPPGAICLSDDDRKMLIRELIEYTEMRLRSISKKNTGKPFTLF